MARSHWLLLFACIAIIDADTALAEERRSLLSEVGPQLFGGALISGILVILIHMAAKKVPEPARTILALGIGIIVVILVVPRFLFG